VANRSENVVTVNDHRDSSVIRRVLMMCYFFPPLAVAGSVRSAAFASLLPTFGWEPTVLSVRHGKDAAHRQNTDSVAGVRVVRTAEWNLGRIVSFLQGVANRPFKLAGRPLKRNLFRQMLCVPDDQIAWLSTLPGYRLGKAADVVYVSCSPFSSALSGLLVKRLLGKPLVVDFRDPWLSNSHAHFSPYEKLWIRRLERLVIQGCSRLILNTNGAEAEYRRRYPSHAHKFVTIPNGYDELIPARPNPSNSPFRIVHVGAFYLNRTPTNLLHALVALNNPDIEFVHVGEDSHDFKGFIGRANMRILARVSRNEALEMMRTGSLLYLKQGQEPGLARSSSIASKTYEYLATGLPILADCPPGDNLEIVQKYASRSYVVKSGSVSELQEAIETAYAERQSVVPHIREEFVRDFDRGRLTGLLASLFDELVQYEALTRRDPSA
jgi:glycosyltransferase involved in cell wall biosynthesis